LKARPGAHKLTALRCASTAPNMDTLTELRQLADDLNELGDAATASLVRQAIDRFSAWRSAAPWKFSKSCAPLQRGLSDLGDAVAVTLLKRAEKALLSWQFDGLVILSA
jgi:hypothetical protein